MDAAVAAKRSSQIISTMQHSDTQFYRSDALPVAQLTTLKHSNGRGKTTELQYICINSAMDYLAELITANN